MALAGGSEAPELREPPLDAAHDVPLGGAIVLGHEEGLREAPVKVVVEEGAVVLGEALHVDLHDPVQVLRPESPHPEPLFDQLQRTKRPRPGDLNSMLGDLQLLF